MRWFLTNPHPELEAALAAAGELVVSTPGHHQLAHYDWLAEALEGAEVTPEVVTRAIVERDPDDDDREPRDYPLGRYLDRVAPDVLVLAPMLQPGMGIPKSQVMRWVNRGRGQHIVVGWGSDPGTVHAARHRWRGCAMNLHNLHVYVTDDEGAAIESARERRTVLWGGPADTLVRVVESCRQGRSYAAGSRARPFV